jgi:hypothetical protein
LILSSEIYFYVLVYQETFGVAIITRGKFPETKVIIYNFRVAAQSMKRVPCVSIRAMKLKTIRWTGHAADMRETRNLYTNFSRKTEWR